MTLQDVRKTSADKLAGSIRLLLGVLFLMTGVIKLVVPMLAKAWSGQLLAAGLPLYSLTRWSVPFLEIFLGMVLLWGGVCESCRPGGHRHHARRHVRTRGSR